jgi:starch-binding outer membrane protein, SusD/RagB family
MKLKINYPSALLVAGLLLSNSCKESNLDLQPTLATEGTYFQTETQFREGVLGTYSKLVYFYNYRAINFLHDVRLLPDDDLTTAGTSAFEIFSSINSDNNKSADYFKYLYQMIGRANSILQQLDKKGDIYKDKALRDANKGELLFLRAYGYVQLWNLYSVAPLVTERANSANLYPSNSTDTQLLDQAITDLTAAAPLLPMSWPAAEKGRVTQGGGYALLGKALLYRATVKKSPTDYQAANTAFDNITGFTLTANFGDNFKTPTENNSESLFEVQLGSCAIMCNVWLAADEFSGNGDISGYWGFFDNHWSLFGGPPFKPTQSFLNSISVNDPRYAYTVSGNGGGVQKYVEGFGGDSKTASGVAYFNNARIIRLADVKLMKAEALVQSGGSTSAAINLINEVRTRARNSVTPASSFPANLLNTETDRIKIMKWIIEERRIELAFEEGHRWFDLRRWHIGGVLTSVYGKDLTTWDFSSVNSSFAFAARNIDLPIPTSELLLNINLKQNPAWSK